MGLDHRVCSRGFCCACDPIALRLTQDGFSRFRKVFLVDPRELEDSNLDI